MFQNRFENSQFESKTLDSFFQWKLRFQTFEKWEFSGQKFRPRSVIKVERGKLAYKTSTLMPNAGPYKKCQIWWDNRIKQDSYSWMSKLLLKERIIEIGLELVICRKKNFACKNSTFFTSEKNRSNTRNEKLFSLLGCGFNKDRTFFQTSSWQYWSTNAQITMQPTKQVSTFPHLSFSCLLVGKTRTKNPLFCEVILYLIFTYNPPPL